MAQPQWYVKRGDQTLGPYSASKFRQLVLQKKVVGLDLVKSSDGVGWSAASSIPGLLEQPSRSSNPIRPIQPGKNEPLSTSDSQELDKATGFMDVCRVLWRLTRKKKIILLATMILLAVWIRLAGRNISNVRSLPDGNNQELVTSSKSRADIAKENLIQISKKMDGGFSAAVRAYVECVEDGTWSWTIADKEFMPPKFSTETYQAYREWRAACLSED